MLFCVIKQNTVWYADSSSVFSSQLNSATSAFSYDALFYFKKKHIFFIFSSPILSFWFMSLFSSVICSFFFYLASNLNIFAYFFLFFFNFLFNIFFRFILHYIFSVYFCLFFFFLLCFLLLFIFFSIYYIYICIFSCFS